MWNESVTARSRHLRAVAYVVVSFALAAFGCLYLHFDRAQTLLYAVSAYVMLNALNHRAMFGPLLDRDEDGPRGQELGR
jgi:hypothetical protein